MKLNIIVLATLLLALPLFASTGTDTLTILQRAGYDQREFTFINQYNQMLWKFLRAVDEVKDGHYKSNLTWSINRQGKITSLIPDVDNSLFTGQSMMRTLGNDQYMLRNAAYDEQSHRITDLFQQSLGNAEDGTDEIIRYYATSWKYQTDAQAGEVKKKAGWTKVWEAMRDLVTKSRQYFEFLTSVDAPKNPYVDGKVVTDLLPPVTQIPVTPPGAPFFGFWYALGAPNIVIAEPLPAGVPLRVGDVILGVYKFGSITVSGDSELDPTTGAERTLVETPSIVAFSKLFNERKPLAGKTFRLLVRREGKEMKIDIKTSPAEGGNIFQR